jgi:hypothetical protein
MPVRCFVTAYNQPTIQNTEEKTMRTFAKRVGLAVVCASGLAAGASMAAGPSDMTFFVTSRGVGNGADLGGLEGADKHCQSLAEAAGAGNHVWHAYLSTQAPKLADPNFVNARDRIGTGPWQNAKGEVIARSVDELHAAKNNITKLSALDENGKPVNSRGDTPLQHDMLTGSRPDGTAFPGAPFPDMTCGNWTKSADDGSAMTGHHDSAGPLDASWARSWNSTHPTLGCSMEKIRPTGGDARFYCFAVK